MTVAIKVKNIHPYGENHNDTTVHLYIEKSAVINGAKFSPKQFREFAKYDSYICHSKIPDSDCPLCSCGIEEDLNYISRLLKEFGF